MPQSEGIPSSTQSLSSNVSEFSAMETMHHIPVVDWDIPPGLLQIREEDEICMATSKVTSGACRHTKECSF